MTDFDPKYLLQIAAEVSCNAYAPYSKFQVGACVLFEDGSIYKGCNVENASYGLSLCAERNAISSAIADGKKNKPVAIAIFSTKAKLCYPCGACRQWLSEFSQDVKVIIENEDGTPKILTIVELLPMTFKL